MSGAFVELERVESRVLGALRCVDAVTGVPVERPLDVRVGHATIVRNGSGLYVIRGAAALAAHEASFASPPAQPPLGSVAFALTVADPLGEYLPRRASLALPRDPDPANAGAPDSLFRAAELPLFPSPSAPIAANWAVLRVAVAADGGRLGGALLRVLRNGTVLARGLTDWRGEALVCVAGVPVTTFAEDEDAVVVTEIDVVLQAVFDPASGRVTAAADVEAGRPPAAPPLVDPAALEAGADTLPRTHQIVSIAARRTQTHALSIALP